MKQLFPTRQPLRSRGFVVRRRPPSRSSALSRRIWMKYPGLFLLRCAERSGMHLSSRLRLHGVRFALVGLVLSGLTPVVTATTASAAPSYPLYSSRPLSDTAGTPPLTRRDPDHPHRELCYRTPCTE